MSQPTLQQRIGGHAERQALRHLERAGLRLIERNYRCRRGELDLIMNDNGTIVFVEVRYRRSERFGGALGSVDLRKRRRLIATAEHFLQSHAAWQRYPARFDVVAVTEPNTLEWIPNAFES